MSKDLIRVTDLDFEDDNDLVVRDVYGGTRKLLLRSLRQFVHMATQADSPTPEKLREKYWDEGKSLTEIAEEYDTWPTTVQRWMKKHGIDRRSSWAERGSVRCYPGPHTGGTRYTMIEHYEDGEYDTRLYSHQLVAIAEGADPEKVFATDEFCTHHINGHEFDNRPSNLEVMSKRAHQALDSIFSLSEEEREEVLEIAEARTDV